MKTIREIAEEIGVTRQAVYNKISKPPLSKILQCFVSSEKGVLTVSVEGEKLIKQAFINNSCKVKLSKKCNVFDKELLALLLKTIDVINGQLAVKDKQIEALTATIKTLAGNAKHKPPKKAYTSKKQIAPKPKSYPIKRLIKYRS